MDIQKLIDVGVNYQEGKGRVLNNENLYKKLLLSFVSDGNYQNLKDAIEAKDYKKAFLHAHSIKGLAANLSIVSIYNAIFPLVESVRNFQGVDADELFANFSKVYVEVIEVIKEELTC